MMQYLDPKQQGQFTIVAIGLMTFVCVGMAACLALVAAAFYLVVQFVLIILQVTVATFSAMGSTWVNADPFTKVLILAALVFAGYRVYQWRKQKRERK